MSDLQVINDENENNQIIDNDGIDEYIYLVKEDDNDVGAFFTKDSAHSFMNLKIEKFCSELISSSYRYYKEWSNDDNVIEVMAYHKIFGIIPYEQCVKRFVCEKIELMPIP